MPEETRLQKKRVDVADLLRSAIMVGRYRGEEVWSELEKLIEGMPDNAVALIDIRQAMPLQYTFCQYAFGPLLEALDEGRWVHKYVIFGVHDFHQSGFFRGVLKSLGTELPRKESQKGFVEAGFYAKLILGDQKCISFIGRLNEDQLKVLNVINEMTIATVDQIRARLGLSAEAVVAAISFLVQKHFVVGPPTESVPAPSYHSLNNYL